jgi:hypothetical protein
MAKPELAEQVKILDIKLATPYMKSKGSTVVIRKDDLISILRTLESLKRKIQPLVNG